MPTSSKPAPIKLVCGLGNPGAEFEHTRHNIGFAIVDELAALHSVRYWKSQAGCELASIELPQAGSIWLAKPQGYMNTSGGPLSKLMRELHISPQELLVIHDEVDLSPGELRPKFGGGLNSHNGLRSISDKLRTRDFGRLRCGIGRPPGKMPVADYVLRQLKGSYLEEFTFMAQDGAHLVEKIICTGPLPHS